MNLNKLFIKRPKLVEEKQCFARQSTQAIG